MDGQAQRSKLSAAWWCGPAVVLAAALCVPPPGPLPEPAAAANLFRPPLLIAPTNGAYRVVGFEQYQHYRPVYALTLLRTDSYSLTRLFGFFRRSATWRYQLEATRFDSAAQGSDDSPFLLPAAELNKVRPLVMAELNRRAAGRGVLLEELLGRGLQGASVWCWQNLLTLLGYLAVALLLAVFARGRVEKVEGSGR